MKYENKRQKIGLKLVTSTLCCLIPVTWCLVPEAHSASLHPLNDRHVIEAEISRQGLTRITIRQDRILNVFGITGEYVLETDEDQGQIFVRPMGPDSQAPISLTLTTEKGYTQDLRLSPKDKAPEALILHMEDSIDGSSEESLAKKLTQDFPSRDDIEELIKACQEDRIPVGYKRMPLDIRPVPAKAGDQKGPHRLIREIRNGSLKGLTYEVRNMATIPWILAESGFAQKLDITVIAIFMPKKLLNPGENAYVYVIAEIAE